MNHAIVTGSTGLVGTALVKFLLSKGIKVLCIGRQKLSQKNLKNKFGEKVIYLNIDMSNIRALVKKIRETNFNTKKKCVFYSIAWGGVNSLTDGNFQKQFMNSIYTSEILKISKELGCQKFINCGTMQETIAEKSLNENLLFNDSQINYSISKIASRDMCNMIGYLEKIDYIHTRLSVPIAPKSNKRNYISNVINNIMNNKKYSQPTNNQLFDIIHIEDVCNAYYLIGLYGQNKSDYYIGTSNSLTLKEYFDITKKFFKNRKNIRLKTNSNKMFNINKLIKDTGFNLKYDFFDILKDFRKL